MISPFTGIQMGPRQLELPPNMPESDSAGRSAAVGAPKDTPRSRNHSQGQRAHESHMGFFRACRLGAVQFGGGERARGFRSRRGEPPRHEPPGSPMLMA